MTEINRTVCLRQEIVFPIDSHITLRVLACSISSKGINIGLVVLALPVSYDYVSMQYGKSYNGRQVNGFRF